MGNQAEKERILAQCRECETVYTSKRDPDGSIVPIGRKMGCQCGSTSFIELESELNTSS